MFAVIRVKQYYDYVEGIEFLKSFSTEEEAKSFIKKIKDDQDKKLDDRNAYIMNFVHNIVIPENINTQEWKEFLEQFKPYVPSSYVTPKNFHNTILDFL